MAEGDTPTQSEADKLAHRIEEALSGHKQATQSELAKMRRDLEDLQANSRRELDEQLRTMDESYKSVREWVDSEIAARKERDRVNDSESTIVVPPNDVTPPPPTEVPPVDTTAHGEQKKGSFFRRIW